MIKIATMVKRVGLVGAGSILGATSIVGMASAQASISDTGPHSFNSIDLGSMQNHRFSNNNDIRLSNNSHQVAFSGNAKFVDSTNKRDKDKEKDCDMDARWDSQSWMGGWQNGSDWKNKMKENDRDFCPISKIHKNHHKNIAFTGKVFNFNRTKGFVNIHNNIPKVSFDGSKKFIGARIHDTGPGSINIIKENGSNKFTIRNTNNISLHNSNEQFAQSGDATVRGNTFGGSAITGDASNDNSTNAVVAIHNFSPAMNFTRGGSSNISDTGPFSNNRITSNQNNRFSEVNNNNVSISNTNNQIARSGNATVSGNTFGGSAITGSASNYNSTSFDVSINN